MWSYITEELAAKAFSRALPARTRRGQAITGPSMERGTGADHRNAVSRPFRQRFRALQRPICKPDGKRLAASRSSPPPRPDTAPLGANAIVLIREAAGFSGPGADRHRHGGNQFGGSGSRQPRLAEANGDTAPRTRRCACRNGLRTTVDFFVSGFMAGNHLTFHAEGALRSDGSNAAAGVRLPTSMQCADRLARGASTDRRFGEACRPRCSPRW